MKTVEFNGKRHKVPHEEGVAVRMNDLDALVTQYIIRTDESFLFVTPEHRDVIEAKHCWLVYGTDRAFERLINGYVSTYLCAYNKPTRTALVGSDDPDQEFPRGMKILWSSVDS
jgi:hypothetical protein